MRILKLYVFALLTTGFFITMSCKKGDTGPAGPVGPDSVMYSNWITLNMTGDADGNGDSVYYQNIITTAITSDILNKGSVIGYLLVNDPLTGDSSVINASLALEEHFLVGSISLLSSVTFSGYQYRYVVVPAKVAVTGTDGTVHTYTSQQMGQMDYHTLTGLLRVPVTGSGASRTLTDLTN